MSQSGVARRYAEALFEVAEHHAIVERCEDDLRLVTETIRSNPSFPTFLSHPTVPAEAKKETIRSVFGQAIHTMTLNVIQLLIDRGRDRVIPELLSEYSRLADAKFGRVPAHVETAYQLSDDERNTLAARLSERFGKTFVITTSVNPDLLGGARFRVGGRVIDATVSGRLAQFERQLDRQKYGR